MKNFNFISIDHEEMERDTYRSVDVTLANGHKQSFSTGDTEKDFKDALNYIHSKNKIVTVYSSSVDNFISDNGTHKYDNNNMVVGMTEEEKLEWEKYDNEKEECD